MSPHPLSGLLALHRGGHLVEAEAGYRALIAHTGNADAMQLLATLLHQQGRSDEAIAWLDRALPHLVQQDAAESNRAAMLLALGRPDEARATAEQVLRRDPGHIGANRNLALALLAMARASDDLIAACSAYRRYEALNGDDPAAYVEFGNALQNIGDADAAIARFERARELAPRSPELASAALIAAHFDARADAVQLSTRARQAGALYASDLAGRALLQGDSLCFGFYSPRFGDGPIHSLVLPVLRELRRRGVRLVLCAGVEHDAESVPFRAVADAWYGVGALEDAAFADLVERERVGVMFDLCGHAPGNRLRAFAARLAAVQVSWGDWFCSTGIASMDLFIADPVTVPDAEDGLFSERVLRLPRTRFAYALPEEAPAPSAEVPHRACFASFNRLSKLTEVTIRAWAMILQRVPESILLLRSAGLEQPSLRSHTIARIVAAGVAPGRVLMDSFGSYRATLVRYRDVSIALDPFPFNGCVTTLDALAMQVPVVALHGRSLVARQTSALLHAIGCEDWVAADTAAYVEIAVRLAGRSANAAARSRLRSAGQQAIFDIARFTDDLLNRIRATGA